MSKEKFYMVKNDKGKYWDLNNLEGLWKLTSVEGLWKLTSVARPISEDTAKNAAKEHGGHVVALIEEPEKVVLTKEQAKIVEEAHVKAFPATFIANTSVNEILFMEAYVNGYTVAKEKKYNVKVPQAEKTLYRKHDSGALFASIYIGPQKHANDFLFTEAEIEHYGLQDCEKEEIELYL